jgi:acetate---CoA ligase (ADP-forming) subunit beta
VEIIEKALVEGRTALTEYESKQFLREYGIPVTREIVVENREALIAATGEIGFPLVLKGCGPHLNHKTERNLVEVDVRNEKEALACFDRIFGQVRAEGWAVLVQQMIKGSRELVAGLTRDAQFGPCVMFGLGGIFAEILKDISFRVAPLEKRDALEMMQEIRARKILQAVRGMPRADLDQVAQILVNLGKIGMEKDAVKEIDINPIILDGSRPVAVDALVVLQP